MKHGELKSKNSRKETGVNIGIVTTWFERGAAYVSRAYMGTLSRKHNISIYARGGERYAQRNPKWDKKYVTWGKPPHLRIHSTSVNWPDFRRWVLGNHLDMVIFNEQQAWDAILQSLDLDIIIGAYVDYYTPETVPFFWLYDFLLCNTRQHYRVFKDHPQVFFIPWGTDCQVFQPPHRSIKHHDVRFFHSAGMIGINYRKGTDILVRAFQNVTGAGKLIIHSQVPLSAYSEDIASTIRRDDRIEFIEAEVGPPGLYHLGDVYVYPTRLEGIGLTIAEALASGLPVITTDASPMNEFVVEGLNGRLVEIERFKERSDHYYWPESICNEKALAKAMQFFVDNRGAVSDYSSRARDYALTYLDWQRNSHKLPELMGHISRVRGKIDSALVKQATRYERSRKFGLYMKVMLHKAGAGRVKRLLRRLFMLPKEGTS